MTTSNPSIDICEELGRNFLTYALDTDQNKAFPSVADGLAPGARAALWEMYTCKYFSNKPHVKSAKVAAGTIGRWWPHNADATYGTLVRMAQPFVENALEVDFQGAVGNQIIGQDSAGSSRYTEMRLSSLSEKGLFQGINKNNVDMIWNYLQDEKWPKVLPAIFPRLLVNGHIGLGVGLSSNFPLHNFKETADLILNYLKTGILDAENYYPDFPTGGTIINKDELAKINETGKGRIVVQSKYKVNGNQIVFYDLPYQVYVEPLIAKIKDAYEKDKLPSLDDVINSSDKKQISVTVTVANGYTPEQCINQLFAATPLQSVFHANQNAIINQAPEMCNLKTIVDVYIKHNVECIKREYEFDLDKAQKRIHILKGLSLALEDIDNIIQIIKTSASKNDAANNLKQKYALDQEQVDAILKMTLSRLANMEKIAINQELQEKEELALQCVAVIQSAEKQKDILAKRLQSLAAEFGTPRRTDVVQKEMSKTQAAKKAKEVIIEDVVIVKTSQGYIKSIPTKSYRSTGVLDNIIKARTDEMILLFSSIGLLYRLKVSEIPQCDNKDKGTALGALLKLDANEKILNIFSMNVNEKHPYITGVTKNGMIKKSDKTIYFGTTQNKNGLKAAGLKDNDEYIGFFESNGDYITLKTSDKMALQFKLDDINACGKTAKGVIGIKLNENASIVKYAVSQNPNDKIPVRKRAGKGVSVK